MHNKVVGIEWIGLEYTEYIIILPIPIVLCGSDSQANSPYRGFPRYLHRSYMSNRSYTLNFHISEGNLNLELDARCNCQSGIGVFPYSVFQLKNLDLMNGDLYIHFMFIIKL